MLLEDWSAMRRLLFISWGNNHTIAQLIPIFNSIAQALPTTQISLLVPPRFSMSTSLSAAIRLLDVQRESAIQQREEPDRILTSAQKTQALIHTIARSQFEAALIFTTWSRSPYSLAYLCYLAGIPIRVGQSQEFGGGVLSTAIKPPSESVSPVAHAHHLLRSIGLLPLNNAPLLHSLDGH